MHSGGLIEATPLGTVLPMDARKTTSPKQQRRLDIPAAFARADRKPV